MKIMLAGSATALTAAAALAQPIAVANFSFEDPVLQPDGFTQTAPPGWSAVPGGGPGGVFYPTMASWNYVASLGNQLMYCNGSAFDQTLPTTLLAGTTYVLRVDVVRRPGFGGNPYYIELYAGTTLLARDDNSLLPPIGGYLTSVLVYVSPVGNPLAGQPLKIRLGGASQTNFDNVRFSRGYCYANCDDSTAAPTLNVNDFICFQQRFAAGNSYANCDGSTAAPVLNVNDFICFQQRYAAGCP